MSKNPALYVWYICLRGGMFWLPVFFLFFAERISASDILVLEASYYIAVVVLEIPSGYFSDRVGRTITLSLSAIFGLLGAVLFFFAGGFWSLFIAQLFFAGWHAFHSGTASSFLFDSLTALDRQSEYALFSAKADSLSRVCIGLAAIAGGALATYDLSWPYAATALFLLFVLGTTLFMSEPNKRMAHPPLEQMRRVFSTLRQPVLLWIFAFIVVMNVMNHVPYEFFQPYLAFVLPRDFFADTPMVAGVLFAINMFVAGLWTRFSVPLAKRFSVVGVLLGSGIIVVALIFSMSMVFHPIVAACLAMRSISSASSPIWLSVIQPRIKSEERATVLSVISLCGRLAYGLALGAASLGFASHTLSRTELQFTLRIFSVVGIVALSLLAIARPRNLRL